MAVAISPSSFILSASCWACNSQWDTHIGLFSLVIGGGESGTLKRIFIAHKDIKSYDVQLHTHRYPIILTHLKGYLRDHQAIHDENGRNKLNVFSYRSPLNGGKGLSYKCDMQFNITEYHLPVGTQITMDTSQFHTVSCKAGAIWMVEELGFKTKESKVLGVPFTIDGLYNKPEQFQINDNVQTVLRQVNWLLQQYQSV